MEGGEERVFEGLRGEGEGGEEGVEGREEEGATEVSEDEVGGREGAILLGC